MLSRPGSPVDFAVARPCRHVLTHILPADSPSCPPLGIARLLSPGMADAVPSRRKGALRFRRCSRSTRAVFQPFINRKRGWRADTAQHPTRSAWSIKASSNQPLRILHRRNGRSPASSLFNAEIDMVRKITTRHSPAGSISSCRSNAFSTSEKSGSGNAEERGEYRVIGCCVNWC